MSDPKGYYKRRDMSTLVWGAGDPVPVIILDWRFGALSPSSNPTPDDWFLDFGEFVPIRKDGITIGKSYLATEGWRRADQTPVDMVIVEGLNVGPDPEGDEGWD